MDTFLLSQIIAAVAFACGVMSFQFRSRRGMLFWLAVMALINGVHFFVLGRPGAGVLYLIIGARSVAAVYTVSRRVLFAFFAVIVVSFALMYQSPINFLGLAGTLIATYGCFQPTNRRVRIMFMMTAAIWMTHNIIVATPVAALMEATFLISNLIGYYRHDRAGGDVRQAVSKGAQP